MILPIEKASLKNIQPLMELFELCTKALLKANVKQWDGTYPTSAIFRKDIGEGNVYLIKEFGEILATITLNEQQDDQYKTIRWKYPSENVLVIHRLAVSPSAQGKGLGKQLCQFSENFGKENEYEVIRLDAYSGNSVSCKMYEKLRYHKADGICWFHGNELPFYCYEKKLL